MNASLEQHSLQPSAWTETYLTEVYSVSSFFKCQLGGLSEKKAGREITGRSAALNLYIISKQMIAVVVLFEGIGKGWCIGCEVDRPKHTPLGHPIM